MNIRLIILIGAVLVFAGGCGMASFLSGGGITLEQAYDNNQAEIIQKTVAGTIPHNVTISNKGNKPLVVDKGTILKSKESQNLVIIEDKKITPNSNDTVKAYCMEPETKAIPGTTLNPSGMASNQIMQIISTTDPSDLQNATKSQLQIWIIVSKGQVDVYSGEAMAVVQSQKIKYYQLNEKLEIAKKSVMTRFDISSEEIQNMSSSADSGSIQVGNWLAALRQWLRTTLGI
ncbi:MAG: hypothetical protein HVN35_10570 [Methanobacteriaceae archaeon]|nr:hypothetical protein [Methanobacteriaceae archaeon]